VRGQRQLLALLRTHCRGHPTTTGTSGGPSRGAGGSGSTQISPHISVSNDNPNKPALIAGFNSYMDSGHGWPMKDPNVAAEAMIESTNWYFFCTSKYSGGHCGQVMTMTLWQMYQGYRVVNARGRGMPKLVIACVVKASQPIPSLNWLTAGTCQLVRCDPVTRSGPRILTRAK